MAKKPVKMKYVELAAILREIADHVEAGDSFEGTIKYSCMDDIFVDNETDHHVDVDDLGPKEFYVGGMFRVGNSMGQGSVNMIWEFEEGGNETSTEVPNQG